MSRVLEHLQHLAWVHGDKMALHDGATGLTYAQLWEAVSALREKLSAGAHSVVAVAGDNSLAWIVADLALLGLPLRVVPIPGFFSARQVEHVLQQAQVEILLGTNLDLALIPGLNPAQQCRLDDRLDIVACHRWVEHPYVGEYEKVTFTSGSTGTPKGVRLTLATLENTAAAIAETLAEIGIQSHLSVLPYATLLENCAGIYASMLRGVTIHVRNMAELGLQSPEQFNPLLLASVIQAVQPQATILVPQLLLALVTMAQRGLLKSNAFRFMAVGGGKVAPQLLQQADALNLPVFEGYGLSECGSVVTLNTPQCRKLGSVGKVLPHAQVVVDDDGEIIVRGPVMKGYLNEPELTSDSVATGDLGSCDGDGFVQISGRRKNMFITAFGRNVNPEWVEAELQCQLPIAQAALFGEARAQNSAVIVPRAGFDRRAVEDAVSRCNQLLPDYARVGRVILAHESFSVTNGMATANGRIRRAAVAEHFAYQLNQEEEDGIFPTIAAAN